MTGVKQSFVYCLLLGSIFCLGCRSERLTGIKGAVLDSDGSLLAQDLELYRIAEDGSLTHLEGAPLVLDFDTFTFSIPAKDFSKESLFALRRAPTKSVNHAQWSIVAGKLTRGTIVVAAPFSAETTMEYKAIILAMASKGFNPDVTPALIRFMISEDDLCDETTIADAANIALVAGKSFSKNLRTSTLRDADLLWLEQSFTDSQRRVDGMLWWSRNRRYHETNPAFVENFFVFPKSVRSHADVFSEALNAASIALEDLSAESNSILIDRQVRSDWQSRVRKLSERAQSFALFHGLQTERPSLSMSQSHR